MLKNIWVVRVFFPDVANVSHLLAPKWTPYQTASTIQRVALSLSPALSCMWLLLPVARPQLFDLALVFKQHP